MRETKLAINNNTALMKNTQNTPKPKIILILFFSIHTILSFPIVVDVHINSIQIQNFLTGLTFIVIVRKKLNGFAKNPVT